MPFRPRLKPALLGASLLAFSLAACGGLGDEVSPAEKSITTRLLYGATPLPDAPKVAEREFTCPKAEILDGTAAYRVGGDSARGVSFQAAINDIARECRFDQASVTIKLGVQGRLILGEAGQPGAFSVPLRVAVRKSGGEIALSRLNPVGVTVPQGESQASFVMIENSITLPITAEDPGEYYTILVGIDPQGKKPQAKRRG